MNLYKTVLREYIVYLKTYLLPLAERVHNGFGGMRDLAVFCGDTWDAS